MAQDTVNEVGLSMLSPAQRACFNRLSARATKRQIILDITDDGQELIYRRQNGRELLRVPVSIFDV